MSDYIRDPSTNKLIGQYYPLYMATLAYYNKNYPDKANEMIIADIKEWGLDIYPCIMRMITHLRFIDAHLIGHTY